MSTKHTPGPWTITKATHDGEVIDISPIDVQLVNNCDGRVNWKNARLIAAAPEMLEALNVGLQRLKELQEATGYPTAVPQILFEAAIAKATGGAV